MATAAATGGDTGHHEDSLRVPKIIWYGGLALIGLGIGFGILVQMGIIPLLQSIQTYSTIYRSMILSGLIIMAVKVYMDERAVQNKIALILAKRANSPAP